MTWTIIILLLAKFSIAFISSIETGKLLCEIRAFLTCNFPLEVSFFISVFKLKSAVKYPSVFKLAMSLSIFSTSRITTRIIGIKIRIS